MFVCVCTREKFHFCFRSFQSLLLVLCQIFIGVITTLLNNYMVRNSKMVFNDSKIILKGMTQLNIAMLVATGTMIFINWVIMSNSNKVVTLRSDNTVVVPKSASGGIGGLMMNLFINICTVVAGLVALTAEAFGLLNRFSSDLIEYERLCTTLKNGNLEVCEDKTTQHPKESFLIYGTVFLALVCLMAEFFKIFLDICTYCQESGHSCNFLTKANLSYEKVGAEEAPAENTLAPRQLVEQEPAQARPATADTSLPGLSINPPQESELQQLPLLNGATRNRTQTVRKRQVSEKTPLQGPARLEA